MIYVSHYFRAPKEQQCAQAAFSKDSYFSFSMHSLHKP